MSEPQPDKMKETNSSILSVLNELYCTHTDHSATLRATC